MKYLSKSALIAVLWLLAIAATVSPQCPPVYTFTGEAAYDRLGLSVASAGDVDNDGFDDMIIGALGHDGGGDDAGRVYVFSGWDGDTIHVFSPVNPEASDWLFGQSVASAGDLNGDSHDDLIIGSPGAPGPDTNAGRVDVLSGLDGSSMFAYLGWTQGDLSGRFGGSVASAGDVDGDGVNDIIIGAYNARAVPSYQRTGRAYVFSGQTGDTLHVFNGEEPYDLFGWSVSSAGDVNNDGFDDLIIGAPGAGSGATGRAYVFSGQTGDTLYVFNAESSGDQFGISVASAGNINGDIYSDLIIGANRNDAGGSNAGRAYVFSGVGGDTIHIFTGAAVEDNLGFSVASAGDVDGDGNDDLIVGVPGSEARGDYTGVAYVFSGKTFDTLYFLTGENPSDFYGNAVASAGDLNGDGFDDLIVGAYLNDSGGNNAGRAYVYSGRPCLCGDANGDQVVDEHDVEFLRTHYLDCGPAPFIAADGDLNCDGSLDLGDIIYLNQYINGAGPPPCCAE